MAIDDKYKMVGEAAQKEMHNIDHITEQHAGIITALMAAIIAFVAVVISKPDIPRIVIYFACGFGIILAIEMVCKAVRHQKIFESANEKLKYIDKKIITGDAERKKIPLHRSFNRWWNGFRIVLYLAIVFIIFWVALGIANAYKSFDYTPKVAGERIYQVENYDSNNLPIELAKKIKNGWKLELVHPAKPNVIIVFYKDKK